MRRWIFQAVGEEMACIPGSLFALFTFRKAEGKVQNYITMNIASKATLLLAATCIASNAAITISPTFGTWDNSSTTNTSGVWDASSYDKLVVIATSENGNGGTNGVISTMTYDGQAMTQVVFRAGSTGNITYNSIWYLDNPAAFHTTGTIATTGNNRLALTAFGLDGTATGAGSTVSVFGVYSTNLSTTAPASFVIASLGMGGSGNNAVLAGVTADSPLTFINSREFGTNWGGHAVGYAEVATAGAGTYGFTDTTPTNDVSMIAVEFRAIPEPSAALLGALGFLALLRRRRG